CVIQDEGCQTKGSEVCNMTIQFVLDQFPSLRGCVCSWKGELCGSIQALATQCRTKPGAVFSVLSTISIYRLLFTVYDGVGSCLDQMRACVSDSVCNRHLAPVLQACKADPCVSERCQQVTQQFYGSMPHNVAEMLVMCECDDLDQSCQDMKATLHTGTCGDEMWICQDTVNQCAHDSNCRYTFQVKCWRSEESQCSGSDLQDIDCFTQMDPALILGTDSECKAAFLATLGTDLHHPCSCEGVGGHDLLTCNRIFHLFHNRSCRKNFWELKNVTGLCILKLKYFLKYKKKSKKKKHTHCQFMKAGLYNRLSHVAYFRLITKPKKNQPVFIKLHTHTHTRTHTQFTKQFTISHPHTNRKHLTRL
uniref:GDNF/GAS1 domain-containing protein n=1 Tax=Mastacembelus armatus TaxID=205130 RepID=A0A3Q3LWZ5_9TELE